MYRFSIAEMMIVVAAVVAAAGIAVPADSNRGAATLAALLIGFTIAGAPLLWGRRHIGTLRQRWGLGELCWFALGLYFLPLALWGMASTVDKPDAERWLNVGSALSAAVCASAALLGLAARFFGGYESSGREWFNRRTTNWIGLAILALRTGGGVLRLAWHSGLLDYFTE
jgi:hypothetical protein